MEVGIRGPRPARLPPEGLPRRASGAADSGTSGSAGTGSPAEQSPEPGRPLRGRPAPSPLRRARRNTRGRRSRGRAKPLLQGHLGPGEHVGDAVEARLSKDAHQLGREKRLVHVRLVRRVVEGRPGWIRQPGCAGFREWSSSPPRRPPAASVKPSRGDDARPGHEERARVEAQLAPQPRDQLLRPPPHPRGPRGALEDRRARPRDPEPDRQVRDRRAVGDLERRAERPGARGCPAGQ